MEGLINAVHNAACIALHDYVKSGNDRGETTVRNPFLMDEETFDEYNRLYSQYYWGQNHQYLNYLLASGKMI